MLTLEYDEPSLMVRATMILLRGTITLGFVEELPLLVNVDPKDSLRFIVSDCDSIGKIYTQMNYFINHLFLQLPKRISAINSLLFKKLIYQCFYHLCNRSARG